MTTVPSVNPAAQQQAAMHRTELLLARCRDCAPPRVPMAAIQAHWHAQQQTRFLAWLDAGGFAQPQCRPERDATAAPPQLEADPAARRPIENSGIAPLFSVP
jgi:hypothetical protein